MREPRESRAPGDLFTNADAPAARVRLRRAIERLDSKGPIRHPTTLTPRFAYRDAGRSGSTMSRETGARGHLQGDEVEVHLTVGEE